MAENISIKREIMLGKKGKVGPYLLAIMPPLTNEELYDYPKDEGVRARGYTTLDDGSQNFVFDHWHFGFQTGSDRDSGFRDFAAIVAAHYGVQEFNSQLQPVDNVSDSLFSPNQETQSTNG